MNLSPCTPLSEHNKAFHACSLRLFGPWSIKPVPRCQSPLTRRPRRPLLSIICLCLLLRINSIFQPLSATITLLIAEDDRHGSCWAALQNRGCTLYRGTLCLRLRDRVTWKREGGDPRWHKRCRPNSTVIDLKQPLPVKARSSDMEADRLWRQVLLCSSPFQNGDRRQQPPPAVIVPISVLSQQWASFSSQCMSVLHLHTTTNGKLF